MSGQTKKLVHQEKRLRVAIRKASRGHQKSKAIRLYLNSFAPKFVAVREAFESKKQKAKAEEVQLVARSIDLWEPCHENVILRPTPKPNDPLNFRYLLKFGLENRARQILVRNALWTRGEVAGGNIGEVSPDQYAFAGGRDKAVKKVQEHYRQGFNYVFEIDVYRCFESFDRKGIASYLNLPERVVANVLSGGSLNISLANEYREVIDYHHSDKMLPLALFSIMESEWEKARLGLNEGSKVSPFAAEKLLAWVCNNVPAGDWRIVNYADNFFCLCKNDSAALTLSKILRELLQQHPAGPLTVKYPPLVICPGDGFEFLGYALLPKTPLDLEVKWLERAEIKTRRLRKNAYQNLNSPKIPYERKKRFLKIVEQKHLAIVNGYQLWDGSVSFHKEKMAGLSKALYQHKDGLQ